MKLDCILDTCPKDEKFVNHIKCSRCELNPLGDKQPEIGCQECTHPQARHQPDYQRWQDMKACGAEVLSITMTRRY